MSEDFNASLSLSGKIPSGLFNSMFEFSGCWKKDAETVKGLCFDGWLVELYRLEVTRPLMMLNERVMMDVPSTWDTAALAAFIEKYGTHIIVGAKLGGKDIIYLKQYQESTLQQLEVHNILKRLADENFSSEYPEHLPISSGILKGTNGRLSLCSVNPKSNGSIVSHLKHENICVIHVRRGGKITNQSHIKWLSTIHHSPDVLSMSFVPLTSLLNGVPGSGFLNHAINLYLRYKPSIVELHQFLEFQVSPLWAPSFRGFPIAIRRKKLQFPTLQFTFMGPKLLVDTTQVDSGNRPVTGIRLFLEGSKNDHLAIHLQHLPILPTILKLSDGIGATPSDNTLIESAYFVPIRGTMSSRVHVCTAPIQFDGGLMDNFAAIVTRAWLEVKKINMKKVLFLQLGFSNLSMRIRRSEWQGPSTVSEKSGSISSILGTHFSGNQARPPSNNQTVQVNSGIYPEGPPVRFAVEKISRYVDTTEIVRGPDDQPGHWVVTGAKLSVEDGRISLKAKYSLLAPILEDDKF